MADSGPGSDATDFTVPKSFTPKYAVLLENVMRLTYNTRYHPIDEATFLAYDSSRRSKIRKLACDYRRRVLQREEKISLKGAEYLVANPQLAADLGLASFAEEAVRAHRQRFNPNSEWVDRQNEIRRENNSSTARAIGSQVGATDSRVGGSAAAASDEAVARVLTEEVLPEKIGLVQLTPEQLSVLASSNSDSAADIKYTFNRLLAHWAVAKLIPQSSIDELLRLLLEYKPKIDYTKLPKTCKTLLKKTAEDYQKGKIRDIKIPSFRGPTRTAVYLHFGILSALLGTSPGLVEKWQWINTMRRVYALFPHLVPEELLQVIKPQKGEEYDKKVLQVWNNLPHDNSTASAERDLVVEIHGHIDGVQWYKNSEKSKGVPLLGRVVGFHDLKSGDYVKISHLQPFIIGVMQVEKKTPTHLFVQDFGKELRKLCHQRFSGLSFRVELRSMICDAPQRAECKGIRQHGGYYACDRCRTRGEPHPVHGKIVYPELTAPLRYDSKWKVYLNKERFESDKSLTHRKKSATPMFEDGKGKSYIPFNYVTGFALESMHLIDGGVISDFLLAFSHMATIIPEEPFSETNKKTYSILETDIEDVIKCYKRFGLSEQSRQLRSLTIVNKFKMRESHVFFMYYAYFVFEPFAEEIPDGLQFLEAMKQLLAALHLTKGFSAQPLPSEVLDIAESHLRQFLEQWKEFASKWSMTFKFHELLHALQDARRHGCSLEFMSSYVYENFHGKWKYFLRNGRLPIAQIRNRLLEIQKYKLPFTESAFDSMQLTEKHAKYMKEHKALELPPDTYLWHVWSKTKRPTAKNPVVNKMLKYMGFELTNIYPQNICIMRDGNIVFCHDFLLVNGAEDPMIEGFSFNRREPLYEDPYDSRDIGMIRVSDISATTMFWTVDDVATKCLIVPVDINQTVQNPIPNSIRIGNDDTLSAYNCVYENAGPASWNIFALILPPMDVRNNICRSDRRGDI